MSTPRADKQNPQGPARSPVTGQFVPTRVNRLIGELREAMVAAVTPQNMQEITRMLVFRAEGGNLQAIRLVYQWVLGKPLPMPRPERLDVEEWELEKCRPSKEEVEAVCQRVPVSTALAPSRDAVDRWMEEGCARVEALQGQGAGSGKVLPAVECHRNGDAGKRPRKHGNADGASCREAPDRAG